MRARTFTRSRTQTHTHTYSNTHEYTHTHKHTHTHAQYKTVLDAIRARKERFMFEDVEIILKPTVMAFITMNPGYPGEQS